LVNQISEAAHRILILIGLKGENGLSFNELRNPPYRLNPKTLAHQLKRLHSWRLIHRHTRVVRGGTQFRYTLTPLGESFLHRPFSVLDLDRALFQTLSRILSSDSSIENQLLGIDLAAERQAEWQVELTVHLTGPPGTCKANLQWEKIGQGPIHLISARIL
jgi:DNA-binding HxlR family transcriptional regulator